MKKFDAFVLKVLVDEKKKTATASFEHDLIRLKQTMGEARFIEFILDILECINFDLQVAINEACPNFTPEFKGFNK